MKENTFKIGTLLKDSQVVKQRIVYVPGCGSKGVTWLGWDEVMYNGKVSSICLVERASGFKPGITYFCVAFKLSEFQFLLFISSVQFSHSVMSDSLRPHEPQHTRPPYPSPTPEVHPNPCLLSQWCHPAISSSIIPFSSCPQSCPASGSFQVSQLFASGGQSIGVSALASVFPMNTQDWSPLGWTGWISLQSKGLSRVFSNTTVQKHQFFGTQLSL